MQLFVKKPLWILILSVFFLGACSPTTPAPISASAEATHSSQTTEFVTATTPMPTETRAALPTETIMAKETITPTEVSTEMISHPAFANVLSAAISGNENAYHFAVEIRSPDTGCEQYADWWEVVTEDGELIYRRILAHSHVSEQPFTRSGGPVAISADTVVVVRAHMHPHGYGGAALRGSVQTGFEGFQLEADFAPDLENADPLPDGCAF